MRSDRSLIEMLHRAPRRILVLNWRDPWHPQAGGAEVMLHEHARRWAQNGHTVTVVTAHYAGAAKEEMLDGIRFIRRGGRFSVYLWAAVLYMTRLGHETDVLMDIENGIPFFSPLYSRKPRVCLVHHVHREQFLWEFGTFVGRVGRFLECRAMPLIYRHTPFLAVSESTRAELLRIGIPANRCRVVHNGLDHKAYAPAVERSTQPRLVYVGRLKRHKRLDLVIDLCSRLRETVPDLVLDIVGTGDDETRLRTIVRERGLDTMVRFHGFASHARKLAAYSHAWALVTATEREGWGLSVIEAAACGTPTLALDAPGIRDAVRHDESGFLAPDLESLHDAASRFIMDRDWRNRLAEGARVRASQFTWERSAAGSREVLADAWLRRTSIPARQSPPHRPIRATLVFGQDVVPPWRWPEGRAAVQRQLRMGDTASIEPDGIHV